MKTFESLRDAYIQQARANLPQSSINSQAYEEFTKQAKETIRDKNAAEANRLGQLSNDVKLEEKQLSIGANVGGYWTFKSKDITDNLGQLSKFKLDAGATFGFKMPLRNLGTIAALYFIVGVSLGFRWTREWKAVESAEELQLLLGDFPSISDLIEVVTETGKSIASLSVQEQRALEPDQVRWRFKYNPANLLPADLVAQIQTIQSISQAAADVMMYIPPGLFATLAMKLAASVGGNAIQTEPATTSSGPASSTTLLETMYAPEASAQLSSRAAFAARRQQPSMALNILQDASDLYINSGSETVTDSFGFYVKLKELGVQGTASLAGGGIDLDLKAYLGGEFSGSWGGGKQKLSASVGIGASANIKFLFVTVPFSFYYTFLQWQKEEKQATAATFYQSQDFSLAYKNLMAAENFSPVIDIQPSPAVPVALVTAAKSPNQLSLQSGSPNDIDFLATYVNSEYSGAYSYGVFASPAEVGTSKTGQLVTAYSIRGRLQSGGAIAWDHNSIAPLTTGFITDVKIPGVLYNKELANYTPVITISGVVQQSDAATYTSLIKATSQISGSISFYALKDSRLEQTGSLTSTEKFNASQFGIENAFIRTSNKKIVASSMPAFEYNSGAVYMRSISDQDLGRKSVYVQGRVELRYSSDPADQVRFGTALSTSRGLDGAAQSLTIAMNGGQEADIPVSYTLNKPELYTRKHFLKEQADYTHALYSGLSRNDIKGRSVADIATTSLFKNASSESPQSPLHWQAVAYKDIAGSLQRSIIQLTRTQYDSNLKVGEDRTFFLTNSSVDSLRFSNDFFSGSLGSYSLADGSTAVAVGGTGFASLLALENLKFHNKQFKGSPFLQLSGLDKVPTLLMETEFIIEGKVYGLWLEFALPSTNITQPDAPLDLNALTREQLLNACIRSDAKYVGDFGNLHSGALITDNVLNVAFDGKSLSLKLDGKGAFSAASTPIVDLTSLPITIHSSPKATTPGTSLIANTFTVRFNSNSQPLHLSSVDAFPTSGVTHPSQWLTVATDDSDGHSLLYLITDHSLIEASLKSGQASTLWLDQNPSTEAGNAQFVHGVTGIAFNQGSTINTYIGNDGVQHLIIGDPIFYNQKGNLDQRGRVFQIAFDETLISYAKTNRDIPFINPLEYLQKYPSKGAVLEGTVDNGLFGESLFKVPTDTGFDALGIGQPGILDISAITKISDNESQTRIVYTPYDKSKEINAALTNPGLPADKLHYFTSGPNNQFQKKGIVFSQNAPPINGDDVQNQDLYTYGLENLPAEVTRIPKNFNGVISSIGSSVVPESSNQQVQLDLLVTDSTTGYNYPMASQLEGSNSQLAAATWSPLSVQWPLLDNAGLLSSNNLSIPHLTDKQILHTVNLVSQSTIEGEPISFTVTNNSEQSLKVALRLEDATGYEGRDYKRFRTRLELSPGETSAPLTATTLDRSGYLPTRIVRLVSESTGANKSLQGVGSTSQDILIQSNDDLDLSRIGTGAAVKANNSNAVALASSPLPGKDQSNRGALALFSGELDAKGLLTKPYISVLKNTDKNYDLSKDDASSKKFLLPADFIPVQAGLIKLGSTHVLAYSGLNATTQGSELYLAAVPDQGADLIGKTSSYFLDQTTKITSLSPTFGQSMISFVHGGMTYFAITDPSSDSVYIVPAQTLRSYLDARQSIDVVNLVNQVGVKHLTGVNNSLFGTSVAEGKLHGNSTLVIGAPHGAENRDASVPTYGGSVYIINLDELMTLTKNEINLAPSQRADAFGLIRVDGATTVDLDPSSSTYLASEGAAIGSSLLFAKITNFKGSRDDQLLLGAPGFMTGDWSTGAVFVLDPNSAGLSFADPKTSTKIVSFNPSAFATGLQTDLSGITFVGDDGDEIGSSLLNLEQFTSGFEFGERNVSNKDVIAIPAPSRFGGAGGVYVYIGNNNEQLALNQLNPSSLYDHTFQYVGTVEGDLPELGIPPRFQVGLQTHSIGKFSQPVPGLGQGNDFSLSIFNTSDPGAVLIYGKPYLYPGTTTSVFDIAAAGFGKPLFGSGNPVGIGDVNLDGVDDFVLQSWNLNGRSKDGKSPDSTLYFGSSPTVLTDYQPFTIPSKLTGWELNSNLAFGAIASSGIGQSTLVRTSLPDLGALYSLNAEVKGINQTPYLNSRKSPLGDTDFKLADYSILAQGNFIENQPTATSLLGLRYYDADNNASLSIANQLVGSNSLKTYSLQFPKQQRLTSLLAADPLRPSDRVGSILIGVVAPSQTQSGKSTFEIQQFRLRDQSTITAPSLIFSSTSFDESYVNDVRYLITGQFSFNGVSYLTTAKTASTGSSRHWQLAIVNTHTRKEIVLDEGKIDSAKAASWLDNLSQAALISSIGDWNGDGTPDVAFTQLRTDWQKLTQDDANPFSTVVRFGSIDIAAGQPFENRYQLKFDPAHSDRILPLSRQTPNQLTAIGDADGSGATSLLASPLPRTDALPEKTISNAFSFQLFPSERKVGNVQKFSGSEGDDLIVIDASRPIDQAQAIVTLEQGDDTLVLDWFGINRYMRPDKPRMYVSGGSGDDVVTIRDGALLQPDSRVEAADAQIDLVYNAGSGFDVLSIGSIINGFPDIPINLTRLLNQASGLDEIQTAADLSIDLKLLSQLSPVGSDPLFISGAYGVKISFKHTSSLSADGLTTHGNANYVGFRDSLSGRTFYLQQGLFPVGLPPSMSAGLPTPDAAAAQVFNLRATDSTLASPDNLTGFRFGTDRISLGMGQAAPFGSMASCSRAVNNRRAATFLELAQSVFADADGGSPGQQPLAPLAAAIVKSVNPVIAGTYLIVNDATPGLDPQSDVMVRWIDHSGRLPLPGPIPVDALFL
ncbi:MAG: hypothetical protein QM522_02075 [Chitinophagaceae bacterium]|nr:hypothetical protein [Chitinophagaceae bacterium]